MKKNKCFLLVAILLLNTSFGLLAMNEETSEGSESPEQVASKSEDVATAKEGYYLPKVLRFYSRTDLYYKKYALTESDNFPSEVKKGNLCLNKEDYEKLEKKEVYIFTSKDDLCSEFNDRLLGQIKKEALEDAQEELIECTVVSSFFSAKTKIMLNKKTLSEGNPKESEIFLNEIKSGKPFVLETFEQYEKTIEEEKIAAFNQGLDEKNARMERAEKRSAKATYFYQRNPGTCIVGGTVGGLLVGGAAVYLWTKHNP